ncbi:MAG: dUTP diphosphatase [Candidatus Hodarchaeales archaeon]
MKILIQRVREDVKIPEYKTDGSSGFDLRSTGEFILGSGCRELVPIGIKVVIPPGYEGQVRSRSGLSWNHGVINLTGIGTIDSDYRGEIHVVLANMSSGSIRIHKGQRIAQMVICPVVQVEFEDVKELPETVRGEGGFGSTGSD